KREDIAFQIRYNSKLTESMEEYKKRATIARLQQTIDERKKCLIYCPFVSQIYDVYDALPDNIEPFVSKYHGSMDKFEKAEAYERFKDGRSFVMLCTKAFGMGVDIDDVERVYHYAPTGYLSDYVQEIGRAARREGLTGLAITDFTDQDMRFVRTLYGLSSIRQYQLREMMRKLYQIYLEKRHRNLLVSPEAFSYLFREDQVDEKVKSGLLLLSKDLQDKYGFPVIVVRPKSLFTRNFVNVPILIEIKFLERFGSYATLMTDNFPRRCPGAYGSNDIIKYNSGNIYELDMAGLWENHFAELTFADFKRRFFSGVLIDFNNEEVVSPRLRLDIHYKEDYSNIIYQLEACSKKLIRVLEHLKAQAKFFSKKDFHKSFLEVFGDDLKFTTELTNIIVDLFVAEPGRNINFNQSIDKYRFLQARQAGGAGEAMTYRCMNSNYTGLGVHLSRLLQEANPNIEDGTTFRTYIAIQSGEIRPKLLFLAIMLELFGLASYEILGGKNTEIFIRLNDPQKLLRLTNSNYNYSNALLSDIARRRESSQKIQASFLKAELSDKERWDIIENYFLGRDDTVLAMLERREHVQARF
ncbi:MAG: helicase-related protein, partial [bacterium]|nr:helicase-related protein [bacterium]